VCEREREREQNYKTRKGRGRNNLIGHGETDREDGHRLGRIRRNGIKMERGQNN
jgi:hypothetical protein